MKQEQGTTANPFAIFLNERKVPPCNNLKVVLLLNSRVGGCPLKNQWSNVSQPKALFSNPKNHEFGGCFSRRESLEMAIVGFCMLASRGQFEGIPWGGQKSVNTSITYGTPKNRHRQSEDPPCLMLSHQC